MESHKFHGLKARNMQPVDSKELLKIYSYAQKLNVKPGYLNKHKLTNS